MNEIIHEAVNEIRSDQIRRITHYEVVMREAARLLEAEDLSEVDAAELRDLIGQLAAYYESAEWKQDYSDDEAGLLPEDLPRGVLSEDGIFDLLEEYREFITGAEDEE